MVAFATVATANFEPGTGREVLDNTANSSGVSRGVFWLPGNPPPGHDFF